MLNKDILLIVIISIVLFSGCIDDDSDEQNENDISFSVFYSSSSPANESFNLIIQTNDIEVFNQSVTPIPGYEIYNEKATGYKYHIAVQWNDKESKIIFTPNGQNILSIGINNGNIGLQEITD